MKTLLVFASRIENQFKNIDEKSNKLLFTGIGKLNASISLSKTISIEKFDRIINIGICGTISKEIPVFSIFSIKKAIEGDKDIFLGKNFIDILVLNNNSFDPGVIVTQDKVIQNTDQHEHIKKMGGLLVDMECYALAKTAAAFKIPFYAFKIVSDFSNQDTYETVKKNILKASEILANKLNDIIFNK